MHVQDGSVIYGTWFALELPITEVYLWDSCIRRVWHDSKFVYPRILARSFKIKNSINEKVAVVADGIGPLCGGGTHPSHV